MATNKSTEVQSYGYSQLNISLIKDNHNWHKKHILKYNLMAAPVCKTIHLKKEQHRQHQCQKRRWINMNILYRVIQNDSSDLKYLYYFIF